MVFMPDEELVLHDGYFFGWNKILDQYCHLGNRVTDLQMQLQVLPLEKHQSD